MYWIEVCLNSSTKHAAGLVGAGLIARIVALLNTREAKSNMDGRMLRTSSLRRTMYRCTAYALNSRHTQKLSPRKLHSILWITMRGSYIQWVIFLVDKLGRSKLKCNCITTLFQNLGTRYRGITRARSEVMKGRALLRSPWTVHALLGNHVSARLADEHCRKLPSHRALYEALACLCLALDTCKS